MSEPLTAAGALDEWLEGEYRREYGETHPLIVEIDRLRAAALVAHLRGPRPEGEG